VSINLDGPLLWFLNRGTGVVLLVLLTVSACLGVLATRANAGGRVPAFVRHDLHRNISMLSVAALFGHVSTAVVDRYVDIRWWQALSPVGASYKPVWLGLGALSLDLVILIVLSSLLRARMSVTVWRSVHWLAYAAWALAAAHATGIGTDAGTPWGRWIGFACVAALAAAVVFRLLAGRRPSAVVAR
jgi:sulfoxide reductase heme-binding subunit YedZ